MGRALGPGGRRGVEDSRCFAFRLALVPLASLFQAGFDHGLLDSPPDCLASRPCPLGFESFSLSENIKSTQQWVLLIFWQGQKDSNPRHAVLETAALPTELYP